MHIFLSQDKLGPFCRTAADCAVVLDAIKGKDPEDLSSREIAFDDPFSVDITKLTVGYTEDADMKVNKLLNAVCNQNNLACVDSTFDFFRSWKSLGRKVSIWFLSD